MKCAPPQNMERLTGDVAEHNKVFALIITLKAQMPRKSPKHSQFIGDNTSCFLGL